MYQKMYNMRRLRNATMASALTFLSACSVLGGSDWSFYRAQGDGGDIRGGHHSHGDGHGGSRDQSGQDPNGYESGFPPKDGIAVGAIVSAGGGTSLKSYQRWKYSDQLASHMLSSNPELRGRVDSYQYVSKRIGKPYGAILEGYRLEGDLTSNALQQIQGYKLRRRFLLLASILPYEETTELPPERKVVTGRLNPEVKDYYDVRYQTIRDLAVKVHVYDTVMGQKVFEEVFHSAQTGKSLATEKQTRKYEGNSVLGAVTNTAANGFKDPSHPKPPRRDDVLQYIWSFAATDVVDSVSP